LTGSHLNSDAAWPPAKQAWTAAVLLACANSLAFIDRTVLTLLVEPIKADLAISDTLISLLTGFSFAVFYAAVGLPVARMADRGNRRNIVATAVLVWSAMTAACGLAWNYLSLLAARAATGAGEGALSPAAQSMLADYFPKERLPGALGLYSMGIYVGNGLALVLGGAVTAAALSMGPIHIAVLGEVRPWQLVFFAAGAPGLLLAAVLLAIREPARRGVVDSGRLTMPLREVWHEFLKKRVAFLTLIGAFALLVMHGHGSGAWIPSFFAREFGWDPGRIGAAYGTIVLLFGTSGALLGGFFSSYLRRRGVAQANVLTCLAGFALATPFALLFPLAPRPELSLMLLAGLNFFAGFPFAGGYAALQELAPNRMRAQAVAMLLFCMNLIGGGFGPTLVALFTDHVFHDARALPHALSISAAITLPAAIGLLLACAAEARARGSALRAPVA
jgi:MFS family permease